MPPPPPPSEVAMEPFVMYALPHHEALSTGAADVEEHEAQLAALLEQPDAPLHPAFADAADLRDLVRRLPKAELHLHIEGALPVELMLELAKKNGVKAPHPDVAAAHAARANFTCLQDFLDEYNRCSVVMETEDDFFKLTAAYLARAAAENVRCAEIFVDAQGHEARGIALATVVNGMKRAIDASPVDASLILCLQRERGPEAAAKALNEARPLIGSFSAIGLAGAEAGNPPAAFAPVFKAAAALGLRRVAHAGEEGNADSVRAALDALAVDRVDHGIRALEDAGLVARMARERVPITLCPISNLRLQVQVQGRRRYEDAVREVLASGIVVTLNSDDPAFFGSYVDGNYELVGRAAALGPDDLAALAANSFEASFLPAARKAAHVAAVRDALAEWKRSRGVGNGIGIGAELN